MKYEFGGKVALVTGAASGIGRATAIAFAEAGAAVVVADVDATRGEETVQLITSAGGRAVFQSCNVASEAEVEALVARAVSEFGRLDFAHNNAGINNLAVDEWESPQWDRSLSINLTGVMLCMRAEAKIMLTQGSGAIVNTASINGLVGNASQAAYTATKHGVIGLTRHAALRWARKGIRVNCVCPGVVDTPMVEGVTARPELRKIVEGMTPMGRFGRPEEIAAGVLWLCSEASSFVTGHPLVIDGGATAD
jgi:NAD(P)-dependent dehydrogenase (short-subunit alcohol dehydrogenase family)